MFNKFLTEQFLSFCVIFAAVKTKKIIILLRIFSALLCFHFLNISVETHKYFFSGNTVCSAVTPICEKETASLVELVFDMDIDMKKSLPDNNTTPSDNNDGEEEEKKLTDDKFYFPHQNTFVLSGDKNAHRHHGVSDTREFISEIIPPPPKA